jgi:hypothetical protein
LVVKAAQLQCDRDPCTKFFQNMNYNRLRHQLQHPHRYTTVGVGSSPHPPAVLLLPNPRNSGPPVLVTDDTSFVHGKGAGASEERQNEESEIKAVASPTEPMETGEIVNKSFQSDQIDPSQRTDIVKKCNAAKSLAAASQLKVEHPEKKLKVEHFGSGKKQGAAEGFGKRKSTSLPADDAKKPKYKFTFN